MGGLGFVVGNTRVDMEQILDELQNFLIIFIFYFWWGFLESDGILVVN